MDFLARLQPIDGFLGLIWLLLVGWGLQTGLIRQLGMLIAVVGGMLVASAAYHQLAQTLTIGFGSGQLAVLQMQTYALLFVVGTGLLGFALWRAIPWSRLQATFGLDNLLGALLGGIWATLLVIVVLTIVRYFILVPWQNQELRQQLLLRQIEGSQLLLLLQSTPIRPVWRLLTPWLPTEVNLLV